MNKGMQIVLGKWHIAKGAGATVFFSSVKDAVVQYGGNRCMAAVGEDKKELVHFHANTLGRADLKKKKSCHHFQL